LVHSETAAASTGSHGRTHEGGRVPGEAAPASDGPGVGRLQRDRGALTEHRDEGGAAAPKVALDPPTHAGEHGLRNTLNKGVG
jgi:hypothetical protein